MGVDPSPVGPSDGIRTPVGLAAEPVENVLEGTVVYLVLVKEFLFADGL